MTPHLTIGDENHGATNLLHWWEERLTARDSLHATLRHRRVHHPLMHPAPLPLWLTADLHRLVRSAPRRRLPITTRAHTRHEDAFTARVLAHLTPAVENTP